MKKTLKMFLSFLLLFFLGFATAWFWDKLQIVEAATVIRIGNNFDMQNTYFLKNLPQPSQNQDIATKKYVDDKAP